MALNIREPGDRGVGSGRWWALGALVLSGLVIGLDTTILITALPTLSTKLGATTRSRVHNTATLGASGRYPTWLTRMKLPESP